MSFADGRTASLFVLSALVFAFGGCSSGKKKKAKKKRKKPLAPVDLPEPPPDSEFEIPEKNADGTFRVRGLIAHGGKHLGDEVEIKGVLTYISPECDPEEAKEKGEECPEPYLMIRDEKKADDKMMVVGLTRKFLDEADLEKEKRYVIKGVYKKVAQGFVATEDGLILANKIGEHEVLEDEEE